MGQDCNFILAMKQIATVASLMLMTSTLFYVNGTPVEFKLENTLHASRILLDDDSETFMQKENNISGQTKPSSEQLEETTKIAFNTTLPVTINQNLPPRTKTLPAIEAKDMEESFVHPRDDDDDDSITPDKPQNKSAIVASINSLTATALSEAMKGDEKHATEPANIFPDNPDKSITDLPLDVQKKFTHDTYLVGADGSNATKASDVSIVPVKTTMMETFNIPTVQESFLKLGTREEIMKKHLDTIALENKTQNDKLPAGVIGLISAIGFATVGVAAYIGLLGWKRYQEYLHGHRELLVNDFDSNDINNFEL